MSLYLEINYAKMVGSSLDRFKIKKESPFHANARCPVCGDSATNKSKTRFHILQKESKLICHCFNCEYSASFTYFLKTYYVNLYNDYFFEKYRKDTIKPESKPIPDTDLIPTRIVQGKKIKLDLVLLSDLPETHPAVIYAKSRKLPDYPFMYAPEFYKFSSQFNEDLSEYKKDEPRLIIPFFDREGSVYAYQGRDLSGKSNQKYITITINPKIPKIFGLDRISFKKPVIIVEGPIDSLFLDNCLASVNASLVATAKKLSSAINSTLLTLTFDNEPRNSTIVDMYQDAIKVGYKIVIWPKSVEGIKDVNEMVLSGKDVKKIIGQNTYSGLSAQLAFQNWKKV